jgi:predicted RNA-binding protein YlxR (DUF448 family)/ribosomal protein L7Ae-like RNA K-turn-binding protein
VRLERKISEESSLHLLAPHVPESPAHIVTKYPVSEKSFRTCLITRKCYPKEDLLRFVVSPEKVLVFDGLKRLPGRGLWITANKDSISQAISTKIFTKISRTQLIVPDNLIETIASFFKTKCLNKIGLCKKAGATAVGFQKVRAQVASIGTVCLLEAKDGALDGRRKMTALTKKVSIIDFFTREELGRALGVEDAVHVGLTGNKITVALQDELKQYARIIGISTS